MKRIILIIFISLGAFGLKAQENSFFTAGVGYPLFFGTGNNEDSHYDYRINKYNINLFVEKELQLLKNYPEIRITPGLAYTRINEDYDYEGLGGGGKGSYKHKAFSGYLKLLYEIDREPDFANDYYFGIQAGYYFDSKTRGSKSTWQMNPEGGNFTNSEEIDKSGDDFFHSSYFGMVAGIKPLGDKVTFIKPKIELAFYPSFATLNSYYLNGEEKKSMFQISILLGIVNGKTKRME
jgi:hypothetical protein